MKYLAVLFVALGLNSCSAQNDKFWEAKNEVFQYDGRIDSSNTEVSYCYSAVNIKFTIVGKVNSIIFTENENRKQANFLNIILNGKVDSVLELIPGKITYDLSALSQNDTNTWEIFKRTEANVGCISFHGITTSKEAKFIPGEILPRKILWIGNSITCAYGSEASISAPPIGNPITGFHSAKENAYHSWAILASSKLKASPQLVCYSGKGIYRNYSGESRTTLPRCFDLIYPDDSTKTKYSHQQFQPDLIIIELGTNDFANENTSMGSSCDSLKFVLTYVEFIKKLKSLHPNSKVIVVIGNMLKDKNGGTKNNYQLTRHRKYVNKVCQQFKNEDHIFSFELTEQTAPFGENYHPSAFTHQKMSEEIVPFIQKIMNW